jgi:hypothetical protein
MPRIDAESVGAADVALDAVLDAAGIALHNAVESREILHDGSRDFSVVGGGPTAYRARWALELSNGLPIAVERADSYAAWPTCRAQDNTRGGCMNQSLTMILPSGAHATRGQE